MQHSKDSKSARSLVLTVIVIAAIGTTALSALYVAGIVGHSQQLPTNLGGQTMITASGSPGGFMLVRNATYTGCTTTTSNDTQTSATNSSTTSTTTCLPNGIR